MGLIAAVVLLVLSVGAMVVYSGTPHGGPTASCGPISAFNHTFTINADCRYLSVGELVLAGVLFFLALLIGLSSRPGRA
ncbi:MAG: hypothetical protein ACRDFX_04570 [Chloroflexota bacterium]